MSLSLSDNEYVLVKISPWDTLATITDARARIECNMICWNIKNVAIPSFDFCSGPEILLIFI